MLLIDRIKQAIKSFSGAFKMKLNSWNEGTCLSTVPQLQGHDAMLDQYYTKDTWTVCNERRSLLFPSSIILLGIGLPWTFIVTAKFPISWDP